MIRTHSSPIISSQAVSSQIPQKYFQSGPNVAQLQTVGITKKTFFSIFARFTLLWDLFRGPSGTNSRKQQISKDLVQRLWPKYFLNGCFCFVFRVLYTELPKNKLKWKRQTNFFSLRAFLKWNENSFSGLSDNWCCVVFWKECLCGQYNSL